jgi:hypothetical protein
MELSHVTFLLFAGFSGLRIVSYLPQIYRVATDGNGASAISYSTWSMWTVANVTTALYAAVNLRDLYLASVSIVYAVCCVVVLGLTFIKRRRYACGNASGSSRRPSSRGHTPPLENLSLGLVAATVAALAIGLGAAWTIIDGASASRRAVVDGLPSEPAESTSQAVDDPWPVYRSAMFPGPSRPAKPPHVERAAPAAGHATQSYKNERGGHGFSLGATSFVLEKDRLRVRGPYASFDVAR